jgi:hypothetical protein
MKENFSGWRIFRAVCIIQLVLVAFQGMLSLSGLFNGKHIITSMVEILVYTCLFVFVYEGLSILNYNFPDIPLSQKQKRTFNILFVLNFLFIALLFARVVNTWWVLPFLWEYEGKWYNSVVYIVVLFALAWMIFGIHLVFLVGMFRIRRIIHERTINTWVETFKKSE